MKTTLIPFAAFLLFPLGAAAQAPAKDTTLPPPLAPAEPVSFAGLNPALPTIWIAGDSTAAKGPEAANGWGMAFPAYFDPAKVNLVNAARGGRSSRTFITEGLWDQLLKGVKPGDVVLIQFGHNDAGVINEDASVPREKWRSRGSIRSLGEETEEIQNIITKKRETVHTYGWYLRKMIADTKAKGATPIVLSLTVRNEWQDGKVERFNGPWRQFAHDLAEQAGITYVDLTRLIADEYQKLGADQVKAFFPKDHTHTNPAGADLNASLVVAGLKGIRKGPFKAWLSAKGAAVEDDRSGWLNLPEPADPKLPSIVLVGDSLVRNGRGDGEGGQWGWGDFLAEHFVPAKINVVNRAVGGLSSRTYLTQGHWERALTLIKPGDIVLIQLGHNDSSPINDDKRARGTIKGTGEETEEIDNILTKKHEVVHSYGWYIRKFVREARAAGATPIVCSLTPRKTWKDGKIVRSGADSYGGWARQVAEQENAAFLDVNDLVASRYEAVGEAAVNPLFGDPNLHTSLAGAKVNAEIVAATLRKLPGDPLGGFAK
jgi:lysophospholipase L1-like esterase